MRLHKVAALAVLGYAQIGWASTVWDGTWKFDEEASRTVPSPITVEHFGATYKIHGDTTLQFSCPVAHSAGPADTVIHCVDAGPGITLEIERKGDVTKAIKFQLDSNGKTLFRTVSIAGPSHALSEETDEYRRDQPGSSLAGTWRGAARRPHGSILLEIHTSRHAVIFQTEDMVCRSTVNAATGGKRLSVLCGAGKDERHETLVLSADGQRLSVTPDDDPRMSCIYDRR